MKNSNNINRKPVVAGTFYPATKEQLENELEIFFDNSVKRANKKVRAVIAPHAGYFYSGQVAASAFNQINPNQKYENVFLIGTSHQFAFNGASIYSVGNYETPLGVVEVNQKLASTLILDSNCFSFKRETHTNEHCLEVELPFLQFHLKKPFKLIPIIIGSNNIEKIREISEELKPHFTENNLFVISTDFSHYPTYSDAVKVDRESCNAILENNSETLLDCLDKKSDKKISNLSTRLCGWSAVLSLLNITEKQENLSYDFIQYQNSGDISNENSNRVVGYNAIVVCEKTNEKFSLSEKDKNDLLEISRDVLERTVLKKKETILDGNSYSENLNQPCGAFVTLHKNGDLRGCIGSFQPNMPLFRVVQEMTISAAMHDSRFSPVNPKELNSITIDISVLTPMKKIESIKEIELGVHGIYIKKGYNSGTFLPQVATQTNWTLEEFLGYCSRDKAGIGWNGWKSADIFTYEAIICEEQY